MSRKATEFQKKEMSRMYRGKEIFKPLNTGWIDEHVACVREWVANIFFYRKRDTTIMIDAGYNYDSLEDKPFPPLSPQLQERVWFAFGSKEEHLKYRSAVRSAYPSAHYPVFEGFDHMEYQIKDPSGFAALLTRVMEENTLPDLPFLSLRQESEARR